MSKCSCPSRYFHHEACPYYVRPSAEKDAPEEVVYGAVARAMALAADDLDWMNVTRWPRVTPPAE